MKIFVSVGTHPQQFDRLLKEMDRIALKQKHLVFAQAGNCGFEPKNFKFKRFLGQHELEARVKEADVVVSHGGAGTIIDCLRQAKRLIVVPRLRRFGEHTNDHQLDLAKALEAGGKAIAVLEIGRLEKAIEDSAKFRPNVSSERDRLAQRIRVFLETGQ